MRRLLIASLVVGLLGIASIGIAEAAGHGNAKKTDRQAEKTEQATPGTYAYLGIGIAPLDPAVARYLGDSLENGQGVLIEQVADGSPAAQAGLKPNDVIARYGNHKVSSPEQFVDMVRKDKPGNVVPMAVIRGGKTMNVKVTLGEHEYATEARTNRAFRPLTPGEHEEAWKDFDSLTFKRLNGNRFQAVINYRNSEGQLEQHKFEGTRPEIRKAIEAETDMPAVEQEQLLQALSLAGHPQELWMPGFSYLPGAGLLWDFDPTEY